MVKSVSFKVISLGRMYSEEHLSVSFPEGELLCGVNDKWAETKLDVSHLVTSVVSLSTNSQTHLHTLLMAPLVPGRKTR